MGEYKIEWILTSIVIVIALYTTILAFHGDLIDKYSVNNYYSENLTAYNDLLDDIKSDTQQVDEAITQLSSGNLNDIFGALMQGTINIGLIFFNSFVGIKVMLVQAIGVYDLGELGSLWIVAAGISIVAVFAWGIIAKIIKR